MKFPEKFRVQLPPVYLSNKGDPFGAFAIPAVLALRRPLKIIAVDGQDTGWDHVSVSIHASTSTPTWSEMCLVKKLFWEPSDCVVQFHPPESDYVNNHPGCLHLWCRKEGFPMPPKECV